MDPELAKWIGGSLGTGTVSAVLFYFYRRDVRSYTDLWKETAVMLQAELRASTAAHAVNTETNREVINLLQALHRRLDLQNVPAAASPGAIVIPSSNQPPRI